MYKIKMIFFLYFVIIFFSCNKLSEGEIIEKWYEPTHTYISLMPLMVTTGQNVTTMMIPYIITDYEDWCIKIKGKYGKEERIETVYISKEKYESLSVGSYLKLTDNYSMTDDNNKKRKQDNVEKK